MLKPLTDRPLRVKSLDDFRAPSRRPWLGLLLLVLAIGGIVYGLRVRRQRTAGETERVLDAVAGVVSGEAADSVVATAHAPVAVAAPDAPSRSRSAKPDTETEPQPPVARLGAEESSAKLAEARRLIDADDLNTARERLFDLLARSPADGARRETERLLGEVNVTLLFSPRMMPEKTEYVIRSGDSLQRIANRFGTTIGLIQKSNQIANPNRISVGDRLRVADHPQFAIFVSKRDNTLRVTLDGRFFKRYVVGTGEYGKTPEGTFEVRDRLSNPPWWPSGGREIPFGHPDNILGTRWMSLVATGDTPELQGYGIHGTWDESSLGAQSSAGCIRMRNDAVEELYLLARRGTPVTITE